MVFTITILLFSDYYRYPTTSISITSLGIPKKLCHYLYRPTMRKCFFLDRWTKVLGYGTLGHQIVKDIL